jgi:subfamily B ATP-binding cassette protein MsbA
MLPHLLRTEEFIDELKQSEEVESGDRPVPADPMPIVFDDVRFSYEENETVLNGLSFNVRNGEFIAFVGESGAGKSTIASLIAQLYEHDAGEITANWTPIEEYDIDEWRSQIAYVRQNPFIFNTTLERNLRMANPEASREEIERVSEIAQVTEFLDDLPNGYETELGDDGVRLSGGQRQRVALARALLEDASVLLLDEATSDLDTNIENRVQTAIESMDRDFTIIAIAHRLSTVSDADRIYTIESGEILEKGEHDTLLQEGGRYAELYSAQ